MKKKLYLFLFLGLSLLTNIKAQHTLKINNVYFNIKGDVNVKLKDCAFENNGTFIQEAGIVSFTGTSADSISTIGGDSLTVFHQVQIDKTQNNVQLKQEFVVKNTIDLQNGKLVLENYNLHLSDTATITTASTDTYLKTSGNGQVFQKIAATTQTFPIGLETYAPVILDNSTGIADTFGIRVAAGVLDEGYTGLLFNQYAVNLTWFVEEHTAGGSDLDMTVSWYEAEELSDLDRANAFLSHYTNGDWDDGPTGTLAGTDPYTVSRLGLVDLSPFSVQSRSCLIQRNNKLIIKTSRK